MKSVLKSFRSYWVRDASFIALLLILVFTIFILPTMLESGVSGITMLNIMLLVIFFVGIWSADTTPLVFISILLFVAHFSLKMIRFSELPLEFVVSERVTASLNVLIFIIINFRLLFRDSNFNFERVLGAVNVYLLIALLGAFVFEIIEIQTGSSIKGDVALTGEDADFAHFIYFSLTSLTTVGFGDLIPANHSAKMLSVALSAIGILYPAVVIARLVSSGQIEGRRKKHKSSHSD